MNKIFNHFSGILDEMIDKFDFFKAYFQSPISLEEDIGYEEETSFFRKNNLAIHFGATRGCLIDKNYDYVIKFDLDESEHGSCDDEINIYQEAKNENLEQYLLEPIFLGVYTKEIKYYDHFDIFDKLDMSYFYETFSEDVNNCLGAGDYVKEEITIKIPLYAYPRAERYTFKKVDRKSDEMQVFISKHPYSPLVDTNPSVGLALTECYGEEEFDRLSFFFRKRDIGDFHAGNVMVRNGMLYLSDYCGFKD